MTREEFEKVFENDDTSWDGDNAWQGLQIISKYINPMKTDILTWAGHDEIGSVGIDELIKSGITKEDVEKLRQLNWMINDGEYLACFV